MRCSIPSNKVPLGKLTRVLLGYQQSKNPHGRDQGSSNPSLPGDKGLLRGQLHLMSSEPGLLSSLKQLPSTSTCPLSYRDCPSLTGTLTVSAPALRKGQHTGREERRIKFIWVSVKASRDKLSLVDSSKGSFSFVPKLNSARPMGHSGSDEAFFFLDAYTFGQAIGELLGGEKVKCVPSVTLPNCSCCF